MQAEKFRHITFRAITAVNALLCLAVFYTAKLGLDAMTDSWVVSISVALGGAGFAFVFWFFLSRRFPMADNKTKGIYLVIVVVFFCIFFGFSTLWSVIALGGREAVGIHMQTVLAKADKQALALLGKGSEEASLGPQFESLAIQFDGYATREANGTYSATMGEGQVAATLRNTANTFRSLASSVEQTEGQRKKLYESLKEEVASSREILTSEKDDLRAIKVRFGQHLTSINQLLAKMAQTSSAQFVTQATRHLEELGVAAHSGMAVPTKDTWRLRAVIKAAQESVDKLMNKDELANMELETFTTISLANAVVKYAGDIFYAWAFALALGLAPFLLIVLLAITHGQEAIEITLEQSQATRFAVEEYARRILDEAGDKNRQLIESSQKNLRVVESAVSDLLDTGRYRVLEIVEELKPEIASAAGATHKQLEEVVASTLVQVREATNAARVEVAQEGRAWVERFKISRKV